MVKCGANLVLDRKVDFSQNWVCQIKLLFNPVQPHFRLGSDDDDVDSTSRTSRPAVDRDHFQVPAQASPALSPSTQWSANIDHVADAVL